MMVVSAHSHCWIYQRIYYVSDCIFIPHNNDVTQKKVLVSSFGHVLSTHGRDASARPNFAQIALSNSELLTFSEIKDSGRHRLGFSSRVHLEHSVMLIVWCLSSI